MGKGRIQDIKGTLIGSISASIICMIMIAVMSHLCLSERVGETGVKIGVHLTVAGSTLFGCLLSAKYSDKTTVICIATALVLWGMMLITASLAEGLFRNVTQRIISVGLGCAIGCAISLKLRNNRNTRKKRYR